MFRFSYLGVALAMFTVFVGAGCGSERAGPAAPTAPASVEHGTTAVCPNEAVWTSREILNSGPVTLAFAPDDIDIDGHVRAVWSYQAGGYVVKVPLNVLASPGREVIVYGNRLDSEVRARFDYGRATGYAEEVVFTPRANEHRPDAIFAPGSWLLPEAGCYQVFVEVDGHREGPFGVTIVASGT
jgi:hypothetical protein